MNNTNKILFYLYQIGSRYNKAIQRKALICLDKLVTISKKYSAQLPADTMVNKDHINQLFRIVESHSTPVKSHQDTINNSNITDESNSDKNNNNATNRKNSIEKKKEDHHHLNPKDSVIYITLYLLANLSGIGTYLIDNPSFFSLISYVHRIGWLSLI